ncbi:MAG TPA: polyprenyl synthetase family protein [Pseudonocardiaceae bacterium]|jgi:geranylgeranyl diphosphate synthase type I|nr:polyprenyl synthetase family protein [Pseudonocardiaceae bacterium]
MHALATSIDADVPGHVHRVLADYFESRRRQTDSIGADVTDAVGALAEFVLLGGKRIRPTFAWWGWRGAGGAADGPAADAVLRAISALELLQAGALLHDDLMDASSVRRGAPTVHVAFAARHRADRLHGEPERFGLAAAVLLGDIALTWADDRFQTAGLPADALARAVPPWQAMRTEMLAGQYIDVLTQAHGDESADAALRIDRWKTAAYTVRRPLHIGAAIAGADPEVIAAYDRFGADLGIAFQLRDDLLGVFGDPAVTGKPAGDDIRDGKRTLLMALGMRQAEPADAALLRSGLGRADLTADDVARVRTLLVDAGAVAAVEQRIAELTTSALDTVAAAPIAAPAAERLAELAVTATRRDR